MAIGQKFALLIGVGDYTEDSGLKGLSTPARNVAALAEVLGNEAVGGFAVTTLLNPTLEGMSKAVSALTYGRSPEDLLLLYFSGHGVKDEMGGLYFSNCKTRKHPDGTLDKGTAMGAATLKDMLSSRIHRRMIVILDCCFGGAFSEGFLTMDDGRVGLEDALGGKGLVVLTAADSMVYALEKPDDDLSIYTRYVHEGLTTGAAASEGSEWISARMLHEYVAARVRQGGYAMKPEIYVEKDGCGIYVARAKPGDPEVRYRRECEKYFDDSRGIFPSAAVKLLELKAMDLDITKERAAELREAVRRPWVEYRENLQEYRSALAEDLAHYGAQLPEVARSALAALRQELSLKDEDADAIDMKLIAAVPASAKEIAEPVALPTPEAPIREKTSQPEQKLSSGDSSSGSDRGLIFFSNMELADHGEDTTLLEDLKGLELEDLADLELEDLADLELVDFLAPEDDLRGDAEIEEKLTEATPQRYQKLEKLLAAGDWEGADQETLTVMLAVANREKERWLGSNSVCTFPCEDLRTIDGLWVHYSKGKFGFSVQKEIYVACGAKLDGNYPGDEIWKAFCDRVGWWCLQGDGLPYSGPSSSLKAPAGNLPGWGHQVWNWLGNGGIFRAGGVFLRLVVCSM